MTAPSITSADLELLDEEANRLIEKHGSDYRSMFAEICGVTVCHERPGTPRITPDEKPLVGMKEQ